MQDPAVRCLRRAEGPIAGKRACPRSRPVPCAAPAYRTGQRLRTRAAGWSYSKTRSRGTPRTLAIWKATSSVGEYLLPSMALIVWRVTPTRSASSCCVISPAAKRRTRMWLRMRGAVTSGAAAVEVELRCVTRELGEHDREQGRVREPEGAKRQGSDGE